MLPNLKLLLLLGLLRSCQGHQRLLLLLLLLLLLPMYYRPCNSKTNPTSPNSPSHQMLLGFWHKWGCTDC
jgi:hypothetical protein